MTIPQASNLPIRYSNSGPVISNDDGGEAVPGVGFQLRMAELRDSQGNITLSGTLADIPRGDPANGFFQASLDNPRPGRRYRATAILAVETTADLLQGITGQFFWDVDAGGFAAAGAAFGGKVGAAGVTAVGTQFQFESVLTLGSALPSPVLDTSLLLTVRCRLSGTANIDTSDAMFGYLALTEHL